MTQSVAVPPAESTPRLSDPVTCGEDHLYNLARVTQIARKFCDDCEDYHVTVSTTRLTNRSVWNREARPKLIAFVTELVRSRIQNGASEIDIVIAGAGDTSILSTCAHAALTAGEGILDRVRFTVLDRCETPLELCRDFAARHGLRIETDAVDLTGPTAVYPADLVILHNILSFVPPAAHVAFLRNCGGWLKPDGRIFVWNSLMRETAPGERDYHVENTAKMKALIDAGIKAGRITINEPIETFYGRLDRLIDLKRAGTSQISSDGAFGALLAAVGLPIISVESLDQTIARPGEAPLRRPHVLAVLGAGGPQ